ncbi:NADPH-dependent FMN reductase [Candidatus Nitrosacidococcus tergens]|uniref:NADPH-dependent FMN reductase n=1 Tax=Candidatus Nitrosacidococcus tergens TaxID=553981 RepID=A0A7G1Q869_9GAMM|nr:NAD(P)H-dependent oxidoreductase [Candidatus Nitrosacidococcus tergens]CAB1275014.1 NADPH-dependent FMN reductase [Candidatus Nitrosacidococcus tergens]
MLLHLQVIIASTRPNRIGSKIAHWFADYAKKNSDFVVELVDLANFKLPIYDESDHPRNKNYKHKHTKGWSQSVKKADAYVFVAPEYNYSPTPALINAFNYVYQEWNYKPCSFVSYGGISGGLRAAQAARLQVTTLKMMPIPEGVSIPMANTLVNSDGFQTSDRIDHSAKTVLDELQRWAIALKTLR